MLISFSKEMSLVFVLLVLCFFIARYHWNRRRLYSLSNKIPGPFALPLIGSSYLFLSFEDIVQNVVYTIDTYGHTVKVWMFNVLLVMITKPEHLQIVLNSPSCLEKEKRYNFSKEFFGNGLLTAPVPIWKTHRKIINPTFNQRILNSFTEIFIKQSQILVSQLEKELDKPGMFDVHEYLSRCSLDIICETAMGITVQAQTKPSRYLNATRRAAQIVIERAVRVWLHPDFMFKWSNRGREFNKCVKYAHEYTGQLVMKRYREFHSRSQQPEFDDSKKLPFLEHLLTLGDKLTYLELRNEVDVFITAGSDTVTTTTGYVLVCLGMYPDIQNKVVEELNEVLGENEKPLSHEDLPKLVYLEKVIKETMRMYPPAPFVARSVSKDVDLGDFILPANSSVLITIIGTNRNSKIWPDPMKFDPERFSPEEVAKRHPYSYIPFSGGPRNCIGMKFGMMSMKVLLANILRRYKIETDLKPSEIRLSVEIVSKIIGGSNIRIKERQSI